MSSDPMLAIPASLAQRLHDYLMHRPMSEVEGLVMALRTLKPVPSHEQTREAP